MGVTKMVWRVCPCDPKYFPNSFGYWMVFSTTSPGVPCRGFVTHERLPNNPSIRSFDAGLFLVDIGEAEVTLGSC